MLEAPVILVGNKWLLDISKSIDLIPETGFLVSLALTDAKGIVIFITSTIFLDNVVVVLEKGM